MHIAHCHCGEVQIVCNAEPDPVVLCHCQLCQRRTGSLFSIAAWFDADSVAITGATRKYTRTSGDSGRPFTFNFCPQCGTSVWWGMSHPGSPMQGKIAVAGGCFAEPGFPQPTISIYEQHKHGWIDVPEGVQCLTTGL